jgi:hypothetical protein
MFDTNRRPKLQRQNDLICAGTLSAHGAAIAGQNGGSSVSSDQEFLTEGDGVIGSPLRQSDSARRSGPD